MRKGRLIISAFGISPPGTMGGNSKIALELARYVSKYTDVHIFLQDYKIFSCLNVRGGTKRDHRSVLFPK